MSGAGVRADIRGTDVCTFCGTALLACDCVVCVCLFVYLTELYILWSELSRRKPWTYK